MSEIKEFIFRWVGLPFIAVMGILFGFQDLVPAWQAKFGGGDAGVFTARHEECGRRSCDWIGDWVSADGSRKRVEVDLSDEPDGLRTGTKVEALDTGGTVVYAKAGGWSFLLVTGFFLAGIASAIAWPFVIMRAIKRWKLRRATAAAV